MTLSLKAATEPLRPRCHQASSLTRALNTSSAFIFGLQRQWWQGTEARFGDAFGDAFAGEHRHDPGKTESSEDWIGRRGQHRAILSWCDVPSPVVALELRLHSTNAFLLQIFDEDLCEVQKPRWLVEIHRITLPGLGQEQEHSWREILDVVAAIHVLAQTHCFGLTYFLHTHLHIQSWLHGQSQMSKTARILGFLLEGANSGTFGYQADLCYKLAKNINLSNKGRCWILNHFDILLHGLDSESRFINIQHRDSHRSKLSQTPLDNPNWGASISTG